MKRFFLVFECPADRPYPGSFRNQRIIPDVSAIKEKYIKHIRTNVITSPKRIDMLILLGRLRRVLKLVLHPAAFPN